MLELGGKNPTIVHSTANIEVAARRIAYGRYANSGHICTAPDHVLVWPEVKDKLVQCLIDTIREFYGPDPQLSPDYGRVINRKNFDRLVALLASGRAVVGGSSDPEDLYIAPTVLVDVSPNSPIMQEEVFGPILPILEVEFGRGGYRVGQQPAEPAGAVCVCRGPGCGRTHPGGHSVGRRLDQ